MTTAQVVSPFGWRNGGAPEGKDLDDVESGFYERATKANPGTGHFPAL